MSTTPERAPVRSPTDGETRVVAAADRSDLLGAEKWARSLGAVLGARVAIVNQAASLSDHGSSADVLVLGSPDELGRHARWHRDLVGDLIGRIPCPLAVVHGADRRLGEDGDRSPILVGVDGSDENAAVMRWATWIGSRLDAPVVAAHIVDPLYRTFEPLDRPSREDVAVRRQLEHSEAELVERVDDDVGRALVDLAGIRDVSMIVVGARRHRHRLAHGGLGAVAEYLLEGANRPVVLVPPPHAE
jgi:nucleotide-binding universal stress UspA family protein